MCRYKDEGDVQFGGPKMNKQQDQVKYFHRVFGIRTSSEPSLGDRTLRDLRIRLMREEFSELVEAIHQCDMTSVVKELADLLYVVYGTAVSFGIDMEPVFEEVHHSNMTKIGGHMDEGGKWIKPDNYSPARLESILREQGWFKETEK